MSTANPTSAKPAGATPPSGAKPAQPSTAVPAKPVPTSTAVQAKPAATTAVQAKAPAAPPSAPTKPAAPTQAPSAQTPAAPAKPATPDTHAGVPNLEKVPCPPEIQAYDWVAVNEPEVNKIYRLCMKLEASDIHLKAGQPPMFRLKGDIRRMDMPIVTQEDMQRMFYPCLDEKKRHTLDHEGGVDYSWVVGNNECRFRNSLFRQRTLLSLIARRVNNFIPSFKDLGLPDVIEKLCHFSEGMVILAGVTGSGKSTTIAAMLDYVNAIEPLHILTVEDPIEFTYTDRMSYINQREIGLDVIDWHKALKDAVRQDPDVILVGELRDVETFEAAVHAAETGHLVFGTIHASSCATTINRILDLFPPDKHAAIRQALANNLKAVVAQKLVKGLKKGRVPLNEVMIINPIIKKLIAEEKDGSIPDAIRMCYREGMMDFNERLRQLVIDQGDVDKATALEVAPNPEQLKMALKGIKVAAPGIL